MMPKNNLGSMRPKMGAAKAPRMRTSVPRPTSRTPPMPTAAVRPRIAATVPSPVVAVARPAMIQPTSQGVMVTPTPHPSRNLGRFLHPSKRKPF